MQQDAFYKMDEKFYVCIDGDCNIKGKFFSDKSQMFEHAQNKCTMEQFSVLKQKIIDEGSDITKLVCFENSLNKRIEDWSRQQYQEFEKQLKQLEGIMKKQKQKKQILHRMLQQWSQYISETKNIYIALQNNEIEYLNQNIDKIGTFLNPPSQSEEIKRNIEQNLTRMEKEVEQKIGLIKNLVDKLQVLQTPLTQRLKTTFKNQIKNEITSIYQYLDESEKQNLELQNQTELNEQRQNQLTQEIGRLKQDLDTIKKQKQKLEDQNKDLTQQLKQSKDTLQLSQRGWKNQIDQMKKENQQLNNQNKDFSEQLKIIKNYIEQGQEEQRNSFKKLNQNFQQLKATTNDDNLVQQLWQSQQHQFKQIPATKARQQIIIPLSFNKKQQTERAIILIGPKGGGQTTLSNFLSGTNNVLETSGTKEVQQIYGRLFNSDNGQQVKIFDTPGYSLWEDIQSYQKQIINSINQAIRDSNGQFLILFTYPLTNQNSKDFVLNCFQLLISVCGQEIMKNLYLIITQTSQDQIFNQVKIQTIKQELKEKSINFLKEILEYHHKDEEKKDYLRKQIINILKSDIYQASQELLKIIEKKQKEQEQEYQQKQQQQKTKLFY